MRALLKFIFTTDFKGPEVSLRDINLRWKYDIILGYKNVSISVTGICWLHFNRVVHLCHIRSTRYNVLTEKII